MLKSVIFKKKSNQVILEINSMIQKNKILEII
jgi:hypothetical protein